MWRLHIDNNQKIKRCDLIYSYGIGLGTPVKRDHQPKWVWVLIYKTIEQPKDLSSSQRLTLQNKTQFTRKAVYCAQIKVFEL